MDIFISIRDFLWGIIKRLYYIIPSFFTDPFDFVERWCGVNYTAPPYLFWLLLGLGILTAAFFTYHDLRKSYYKTEGIPSKKDIHKMVKLEVEKGIRDTKPQEGSLDNVTQQDRNLIIALAIDMIIQHGHMDVTGLLADRASGISLNKLMARKCSVCGIPRNQRGK